MRAARLCGGTRAKAARDSGLGTGCAFPIGDPCGQAHRPADGASIAFIDDNGSMKGAMVNPEKSIGGAVIGGRPPGAAIGAPARQPRERADDLGHRHGRYPAYRHPCGHRHSQYPGYDPDYSLRPYGTRDACGSAPLE
jgi:hypothetical protein